MQQTTQIQATSLEITAVSNEKKPNRLVGFFSGIRDKFDGFKSVFKQEQDKNKKAEQNEKTKDENGIAKKDVKIESAAFANARGEINNSDVMADKVSIVFLLELLQAFLGQKKFVVDDIVKELRKNETLTRELNATMIQSALEKNANLSKELVSAKLEQAINENPNYTQEQKDFYLSKLADKDFMDKFYDTLGIKKIANKAKSNDELLALVNESFNGNFTKAKEKIGESQINSNTMNSLDDTALKDMSRDEMINAIEETLKENKGLADTAGKVRKQD